MRVVHGGELAALVLVVVASELVAASVLVAFARVVREPAVGLALAGGHVERGPGAAPGLGVARASAAGGLRGRAGPALVDTAAAGFPRIEFNNCPKKNMLHSTW